MDTVLELPADLREELKAPLGPVFTDADALLAGAHEPIVAVGDVVTYHLLGANYRPAVAVLDGRTKRGRIDPEIGDALGVPDASAAAEPDEPDGSSAARADDQWFDEVVQVQNPAATLTSDLLGALTAAIAGDGSTVVVVDGEEDLAVLPAVLAVPDGGAVVYGQPDEGMVLVVADADSRGRVREILTRMDGDHEAFWRMLDTDPIVDD